MEQELKDKLKGSFGGDTAERRTTMMPAAFGPRLSPYGYTSESEIRERIMEAIASPPRKMTEKQMHAVGMDMSPSIQNAFAKQKVLSPEERLKIGEDWIARRVADTKKQGRLMTDQQLADWRMSRKLCQGDRARYIGPTRDEITQANLIVPRPTGQTGIITRVMETKTARLITFHPDDAVMPIEVTEPGIDKQFVDLEVREHTPGWLMIERIP